MERALSNCLKGPRQRCHKWAAKDDALGKQAGKNEAVSEKNPIEEDLMGH